MLNKTVMIGKKWNYFYRFRKCSLCGIDRNANLKSANECSQLMVDILESLGCPIEHKIEFLIQARLKRKKINQKQIMFWSLVKFRDFLMRIKLKISEADVRRVFNILQSKLWDVDIDADLLHEQPATEEEKKLEELPPVKRGGKKIVAFQTGVYMRYEMQIGKYHSFRDEFCSHSGRSLQDFVHLFQRASLKLKFVTESQNPLVNRTRYDREYNIHLYQNIGIDHICVVLLYTSDGELCAKFRRSFQKLHPKDKECDVRKRHCSKFYWFGRFLYESITYFGMDSAEVGSKKFYYGSRNRLIFDKFNSSMDCPLSVTEYRSVAIKFSTNHEQNPGLDGIVLIVRPKFTGKVNEISVMSIDFLSVFPFEAEYLFYGKYNQLQFRIQERLGPQFAFLEPLLTRNEFNFYYSHRYDRETMIIEQKKCLALLENYLNGNKSYFNCAITKDRNRARKSIMTLSTTTERENENAYYYYELLRNWCEEREFIDLSCLLWDAHDFLPGIRELFFKSSTSTQISIGNIRKLFPNLSEFRNVNNQLVKIIDVNSANRDHLITQQQIKEEEEREYTNEQIVAQKFTVLLKSVFRILRIECETSMILSAQFNFEMILDPEKKEEFIHKLKVMMGIADVDVGNEMCENIYSILLTFRDENLAVDWKCSFCGHLNGKIMVNREWRYYNESVHCGLCGVNKFTEDYVNGDIKIDEDDIKVQMDDEKKMESDSDLQLLIEEIKERAWIDLRLIMEETVENMHKMIVIAIESNASEPLTDEQKRKFCRILHMEHQSSKLCKMGKNDFHQLLCENYGNGIRSTISFEIHNKIQEMLERECVHITSERCAQICQQISHRGEMEDEDEYESTPVHINVEHCSAFRRMLIAMKYFQELTKRALESNNGKYSFSIREFLEGLAYESLIFEDLIHMTQYHFHDDCTKHTSIHAFQIKQVLLKYFASHNPCTDADPYKCVHIKRRYRERLLDDNGDDRNDKLYFTGNGEDFIFIDVLDYLHSRFIHHIIYSDNGDNDTSNNDRFNTSYVDNNDGKHVNRKKNSRKNVNFTDMNGFGGKNVNNNYAEDKKIGSKNKNNGHMNQISFEIDENANQNSFGNNESIIYPNNSSTRKMSDNHMSGINASPISTNYAHMNGIISHENINYGMNGIRNVDDDSIEDDDERKYDDDERERSESVSWSDTSQKYPTFGFGVFIDYDS